MNYTISQLEEKLEKLREDYTNANPADRKLIVIRGNLIKQQIEEYKKKGRW